MIGKREEYARMHATEQSLWWYQSLHRRVTRAIQQQFDTRKDIRILDAGCGTGGLLEFLRKQGYTNLEGLDASKDAVSFSQGRGLNVTFHNLLELPTFQPDRTYDVIVCDDVFCYLNDEQIVGVMTEFHRRLRPNGIFVSNNNAYAWMGGTHGLALNITKRFVLGDLQNYARSTGFRINQSGYWSLGLFPPIALVRLWQNLQIRMGWVTKQDLRSDVSLPSAPVNTFLNGLMKLEENLWPLAPFGSSVFTVMHVSND